MSEEKKTMELEDFRSIFVGEEEFPWELEQNGKKILVVYKALTTHEMSQFSRLLERKKITMDNISVYSDELRMLKMIHAIKHIEVEGTPINNIDDKEKFGAWLRTLPDHMIKALALQYDTFTGKIFNQLEGINDEDEEEDEQKKT